MSPLSRWSPVDLEARIGSGEAVLVDLQADWCLQCGPQEVVLERVAPEYPDVVFGAIDVGEHPSVADAYTIRSLPAMLLFESGELRDALLGFKRAPLVRQALDRLVR